MGLWEDIVGFFSQKDVKEATKDLGGGPPLPGTPRGDAVVDTIGQVGTVIPAAFLSSLDELQKLARENPKALQDLIRGLMVSGATALALLSFIPAQANFGAPTAAAIFDKLINPFATTAYIAPLQDGLDNFFPTREMAPRMLVSGVEAGAIPEETLMEELVDAGIKDRGIKATLTYARVKRFEAATKDDVAILRDYQRALTTFTVQTLQDELRQTLTDLRDRRRELARELRGVRTGV